MKKFNYLVGMLAVAATFSACSNDEIVQNNNESTGTAYMTVQIASANGETRTAGDDFDKATEDENENAIKKVTFYFYNASGNYMTQGKTVTSFTATTSTEEDKTTNNIAKIYDAVVALETSNIANTTTIKQVLAVANSDADISGMSLADAKKELAAATAIGNTTDGFVMTNSVHGSNVDGTTAVTEENFAQSETDAKEGKGKPVTIYMERLAIKVNVDDKITNSETSNVSITSQTVDGIEGAPTLSAKIIGWGLTATEPSEYLIKKITSGANYFTSAWTSDTQSSPATSTTWNDDANHRCYWAESPNYAAESYPTEGFTTANPKVLNYLSYKEIGTSKKTTAYCTEHTYNNNAFSSYLSASTSLIVIAQLTVNGETQDLIKFNGTLYTTGSYKNLIIKNSGIGNYYKKTTSDGKNTYTKISADDIVIPEDGEVATTDGTKTLVDGQVACQIKTEGIEWVQYNGGDTESDDSYSAITDETLKAKNVALVDLSLGEGFKGGRMYYSVPIKHLVNRSSSEDGSFDEPKSIGEYGVVRNHVYSIELSGISGIGHAIWNPDEHIVPNGESTTYFLASTLKVLSWRIVPKQSVTLK